MRSSKDSGGDGFRNIHLVCYLYRHGAMEVGKDVKKGSASPVFRRPAACASKCLCAYTCGCFKGLGKGCSYFILMEKT